MARIDSTNTTYDNLAPFFGGESGKSRLFITLNYKGSKYDEPINTRENPDTIKAEPIWQLMLAKNYNKDGSVESSDENMISEAFVKFVTQVASYHRTLDPVGSNTMTDTHADVARLYKHWADLTQDARDFYTQNTNFVSQTENVTKEAREGLDLNALRLNLKKRNITDKETVFGTSLPFLPVGTKVLFNGRTVEIKSGTVDMLQKLYHALVTGTTYQAGGARGLDDWATGDIKLDVNRFVRNCLYVQSEVQRGVLRVKGELSDVYDVAREIYTKGNNGHIMRGNVDLDDVNAQVNEAGVPEDIYTCILKGDPRELARCLGAIRTSQLYEKARQEVSNMHPKVLDKLLKTFAFAKNRDGSPEEFLVWRANLAGRLGATMNNQQKGEATANAILANTKLVEYLKSVVSLYRNNPALHGQSAEPLSDLPVKTANMGSSKGLNYFVRPLNVNRAEAMSRSLNMMAHQLNIMPQGLPQFNLGLQVPNMMFGQPNMGIMMGGGCDDPVTKEMRTLYEQILNELKNRGKDLVDEDKKRIEKALSQIEENNKQLCKALNDLKAFYSLVKVDSALTTGLSSVSLSDIEGASRIPNLRSSVSNLESCVNRTSRDQVSLLSALVEQVYRPMVLLASGVNSPNIRLA
jgi:hypothetical protein